MDHVGSSPNANPPPDSTGHNPEQKAQSEKLNHLLDGVVQPNLTRSLTTLLTADSLMWR